jgi:hypothetical protein
MSSRWARREGDAKALDARSPRRKTRRDPYTLFARVMLKISGGDIEEVTPDPIPNSEVKLFGANGTAGGTQWESRSLPGSFYW